MNIKEAKATLGIYYLNKADQEENLHKGVEFINEAIADGDIGLSYVKGFLCINGYIDDPDGTKAFKYMKISADSGNVFGIKYLGDCYENGIGTKINPEKAFKLHKKLQHWDTPMQCTKPQNACNRDKAAKKYTRSDKLV